MKRFLKKAAFPCLLTCACVTVWFWQHAAASLPYLPLNGVVPLGIMTPALPVLAFFTAFVMLKQSNTPRPVFRALLAALAMLAVILGLGVYFLSYLSYRFAAVLPVPVLPDWPTGIVTLVIALLLVAHLTGLLVFRLVKQKAGAKRAVPAALGWLALNACLFLITV